MSKLAQKILSNTAIQVFGKAATAILSVVIIKYITSLETIPGLEGLPAEYKLIYTYLGFFGIVADFGLFTIAVREMAQAPDQEEKQNILGNIFGMRLCTIVITMALASLFVFLIPLENYTLNVKIGVCIAAITTILTMLASTTSSILQVELRMKMPTLALILGKLIMAGYIVYVVTNFQNTTNGFFHLLYAGIAGALLTFIITWYYTKKWFPFKPQYNVVYWKKVFYEALPYGAAIILATLYFKVDVLILSFLREKQEIALYGYPSSIIEMLSIFPVYFMNSTLPTLTRAFQENKQKAQQIISLSFQFISMITLPMVVGGLLLARPLMGFIMNEEFLTGNTGTLFGADVAFQLLLFPTIFAFTNVLLSFILIAKGKQSKLLRINLIGVIFNIITNLIFIPSYGFVAAGITTILSEALVVTLTYLECRKETKLFFHPGILIRTMLAVGIMGVFVWLAQNSLHVIPLIIIGAMIFFLALIPLRVLNEETIQLIKSP